MEQSNPSESGESVHPSAYEQLLFAMMSRKTVEFIKELALATGMSQRWVIDHIVRTYAATWGTEPQEGKSLMP